MNLSDFVITGFDSILYVKDKKGQTVHFESRYASCFIVTKHGRITFSAGNGIVISENGSPVFIPEGMCYTNVCDEDAESYVFNFHMMNGGDKMLQLSDAGIHTVQNCYDNICKAVVDSGKVSDITVFKELYTLAELLFAKKTQLSDTEKLVSDAVKYMAENYHLSTLTVKNVAEKCFVSEIYLRKLFSKHRNTTPFKELTDIRMNRARALLLEKRSVKETAVSVGYSDIYQFSRAYKKHFGYPPSEA